MKQKTATSVALPDKLNGHRKAIKDIYVPGPDAIKRILDGYRRPPRKMVGRKEELMRATIAQENGRAVLLAGPTGSGKSLLAQVFAQEKRMPFIPVPVTEDTTEAKMKGYVSPQTFTVEIGGKIMAVEANVLVPSALAIAAMAQEPVVLFIDELHKMRKGVTSLMHSLANQGERCLPMVDLTGEVYMLHPGTTVFAALNPEAGYGSGFSELDPALRRRFVTIYMDLPGTVGEFMEVVDANLENGKGGSGRGPRNYKDIKEKLVAAVIALNSSRKAHGLAAETGTDASGTLDDGIEGDTLVGMIEGISPDSVIAALEFIRGGVEPAVAVAENIIHPVVESFGSTVTALGQFFQAKGVW